ncbi:methyltransferase domain-containing protein [Leucobacter sp. gxy201]|uniref:methyltransferase domain-containing protein n=1 Tax=Leucobacter sp. gxy201 TaxID=2957200 RepID=UPI003D9FD5CA
MNLAERDARLAELMDDPACDPERLRRTLRRFGVVNRAVSSWGSVYRSHLRPVLAALDGPARMLDIGSGGGDVLRRISRLALRDGFRIEALGIDPDPRALGAARAGRPVAGLSFRETRSRTLVEHGARFDIVISNHLLHHLDDDAFRELLSDSAVLATRLVVHSDIARSRTAYLAFAAAVTPIAPGSFLRVDGLRSIRRSYTLPELEQRLPAEWRAESPGPFRLLAVHRGASEERQEGR